MSYFKLINEIGYERLGGSKEEYQAALTIYNHLKELNLEPVIEEFTINDSVIKEEKLTINDVSFPIKGHHLSQEIDEELEYLIVDSLEHLEYLDCENKALFLTFRLTYKVYEEVLKKKPKALICVSNYAGSLYDEEDKCLLDHSYLRERHLKFGKVACFQISVRTLEEIATIGKNKCHLTLKLEDVSLNSHNVVGTIKGKCDKVICFSAHYDSVINSKGIYDNATGSATILELAKLIKEPYYTLKFIFCGSEERGLLGSKEYTNKNKELLANYLLNINVDMTSCLLGYDYACVTGHEEIKYYILHLAKEVAFPIKVDVGVYSSDSTPFADSGVPSISFARLAYQNGCMIHSNKDDGRFLSEDKFLNTVNFIYQFYQKLNNSKVYPFNKIIPDKIKEDINKYYGR